MEVFRPKDGPKDGVNRGLDAWRRQAERLRDTWAEARLKSTRFAPSKIRVLARIRYVTKGADTGLPFDTPMAAVFFMTDGKIRRGHYFWKIDEALEAAGLRE